MPHVDQSSIGGHLDKPVTSVYTSLWEYVILGDSHKILGHHCLIYI